MSANSFAIRFGGQAWPKYDTRSDTVKQVYSSGPAASGSQRT